MKIKDLQSFIESFNFEGLVSYFDFESHFNDIPIIFKDLQKAKVKFSSVYHENLYLLAFIRKKREYLTDILNLENYKIGTNTTVINTSQNNTSQESNQTTTGFNTSVMSNKLTDNNAALIGTQLPEVLYNNLSINEGNTTLNNNDINTLKVNVNNALNSSQDVLTSNKIQDIINQLNDFNLEDLKHKYLNKFSVMFQKFGAFGPLDNQAKEVYVELEDHKNLILNTFKQELSNWAAQRERLQREIEAMAADAITHTGNKVASFLTSLNVEDILSKDLMRLVNLKIQTPLDVIKQSDLNDFKAQQAQLITEQILNDLNPFKSDLNNVTETIQQLTQDIESKTQELWQEIKVTSQRLEESQREKITATNAELVESFSTISQNVTNSTTLQYIELNKRIEAIAKGQDFKIVWNLPHIDWESVAVETFGNNGEDFRLFFLPDESDRLAYLSYLKTAAPFTEVKNFIEAIAVKLSTWSLSTRRTIYFTDSVYAGGGILYNEAQGGFLNSRSKYGNITNVKKSLYSFFIVWEPTSPVESNKFATIQRAILVQD